MRMPAKAVPTRHGGRDWSSSLDLGYAGEMQTASHQRTRRLAARTCACFAQPHTRRPSGGGAEEARKRPAGGLPSETAASPTYERSHVSRRCEA
ncbi:hypothetical protein RJ55_01880 [Drechmeria coniospora]|nr:hypothetical protein RJ55_01880 [Drechmeria coniospora]